MARAAAAPRGGTAAHEPRLAARKGLDALGDQAGEGPATLTGTAGKDVIFGSGNGDTLTGNGGQDQFVFSPALSGAAQHTITDFDVNLDKIDVRQFHAITASALPTETQQGNDTLITLDTNDTILLKNVVAANLHASDFILHS